jgi:hypothetical protein
LRLIVLLAGCAAGTPGALDATPDDTAAIGEGGNAGAGADATEDAGVPTHWSLRGTLSLAGDAVDPEATALIVEIVDAARGVVVCTADLDVTGAIPVVPDDSVTGPRGAWGPFGIPTPSCTRDLPAHVTLALGDVPADVRAQATEVTGDALGAWAGADDAPSLAFGLAVPRDGAPPVGGRVEGAWTLTPVYGWTLAGQAGRGVVQQRARQPLPPQERPTAP